MIEFSTDNLPYEKVGKNEPVCIADEVPFEIPDSWEWTRLGHVITLLSGTDFKPSEYNDKQCGIPYITGASSLSDSGVIVNRWTETPRVIANKGDVLLVCKGSGYGKTVICDIKEAHIARQIMAIKNLHTLDMNYIRFFLQSCFAQIKAKGQGVIPGIDRSSVLSLLFPLPPLHEQKRIVAKLFEVMSMVNVYGTKEETLYEYNAKFPLQLKKSILQWAVQGRLVPQDPNDEPASSLLERIRAEKQRLVKEGKIKKDKHESVIFRRDNSHYEKLDGTERCIDDELPLEIPETWEWIRLGTLFQHNTGKALNASNRAGQKLTYITTSNLYWDRFVMDSLKEMFFTDSEIEKCTVQQGDLLVCEGGDIGRAAIWNYNMPMRIQNHIHRLRAYVPICTRFFYYLFYLYKGAGWIGGKGIGIQGLSSNAIHNLLFPLPPLKEQFRIVEKLDNALQIVNAL